ncbi:MAG: GGDEF domain-containing protein [Lachnospiraceae bacterium]|nr:GGDEF domain-containing protein [Lachnospiraceae bacterium]
MIPMKILDELKSIVTRETTEENESKKMAVLIRILCLTLIAFFAVTALAFTVIGRYSASLSYLVLAFLYLTIFALSFHAPKMVLVWTFIIMTTAWAIALLWLFGPDSSFQIFAPFVIIIFFFASYDSLRAKVIFAIATAIVYQGTSYLYGDRDPIYVLSVSTRHCIRDSNMFIIILCTCIAAHIFSKDSQVMEKKLIEYNKRLKEKANTDPLTGLNNRGMAMEYLQDFVKRANEEICSICICDIDHFKYVNDTFGHDIGDQVLKAVASAMSATVGDRGFVARWGGEEFFIAFPSLNGDEAKDILYSLQSAIRKTAVHTADQTVKVTLTYGLTEYDREKPLNANIKDADSKLYLGKERGRNTIIF